MKRVLLVALLVFLAIGGFVLISRLVKPKAMDCNVECIKEYKAVVGHKSPNNNNCLCIMADGSFNLLKADED